MKGPVFIPTFFRSMFYQANWNVDNMQGTGFSWLIKDLFRRNKISFPEEFAKKIKIPSYFNTNPYLITFILGMLMKECEENGKPLEYGKAYASALAALGDSFFWHSLRPFTFFLSILVALAYPDMAVFFYLILYNFFHIGFRFLGFYGGWTFGRNVIIIFRRIAFNRWTQVCDSFSVFMAGVAVAAAIRHLSGGHDVLFFKAVILFFAGLIMARMVKAPLGFMCVACILGLMLILGV